MDDTNLKAFSAIVEFVNSLWNVYATKNSTPLALYRRVTQKVTVSDKESMEKAVSSFKSFFLTHMAELKEGNVPPDTVIQYGKGGRIHLEVGKFLGNKEIADSVKEHLFGIAGILYPEEIRSLLEAKSKQLPQGEKEFVRGMMEKIQGSLKDVDIKKPKEAMIAVANSGAMDELFAAFEKGNYNPLTLFTEMQEMIEELAPGEGNGFMSMLPMLMGGGSKKGMPSKK